MSYGLNIWNIKNSNQQEKSARFLQKHVISLPLTGQLSIFHVDFFKVLCTRSCKLLLRWNGNFICICKILILKLVLGRGVFIYYEGCSLIMSYFLISEIFD